MLSYLVVACTPHRRCSGPTGACVRAVATPLHGSECGTHEYRPSPAALWPVRRVGLLRPDLRVDLVALPAQLSRPCRAWPDDGAGHLRRRTCAGCGLAARRTERLQDPLLAYAAAEIFIGLFAFIFHPLFVGFTGWAYDALLPAACGASGWCATQWVTAALLIAAPAIALGATFPWMAAGVLRRFPQTPGHEISVLYFLNSLGAVFGVLASAFVFIPAFGLPGTVMLAGTINIAIGIVVFVIARPARAPAVSAAAPVAEVAEVVLPPKGKAAKRAAAAAVASVRLTRTTPAFEDAGEVASGHVPRRCRLDRLVVVHLRDRVDPHARAGARPSTHAFELMLAAFILGLATGGAGSATASIASLTRARSSGTSRC